MQYSQIVASEAIVSFTLTWSIYISKVDVCQSSHTYWQSKLSDCAATQERFQESQRNTWDTDYLV